MRKIFATIVIIISATISAFGQYATDSYSSQDMSTTKEYKFAKTAFYSGLTVAGIGLVVNLAGNAICVVEQNKYTNSHTTTGTIEEIYSLNQEAKQQPGYKRGEVMEIAGFTGLVVGGLVAWFGYSKMKKLEIKPNGIAYNF